MTLASTRLKDNRQQLEVLTTISPRGKLYSLNTEPSPPNSCGSVYSPNDEDDNIPTPFNSHDSFELELKFTEDRGEYIFCIESPYTASTPHSFGSEWDELRSPQSSNSSPTLGTDHEYHISNYGSSESSPASRRSASPERSQFSPTPASKNSAARGSRPSERRRAPKQCLNKPLPKTAADFRRRPPAPAPAPASSLPAVPLQKVVSPRQRQKLPAPAPAPASIPPAVPVQKVVSPRQRQKLPAPSAHHAEIFKQRRSRSSGLSSTPILLDTILEHDQLDFHHFPIHFPTAEAGKHRSSSASSGGPDGFQSVEAFSQYFHGPPPPVPVPNYIAAAMSPQGAGNQEKLDHLLGRVRAQKLVCLKNAIQPRIPPTEHRLYEMI